MSQKSIPVTPGQFKSFRITAAAICYTLSALLGIVGVVLLFDAEYAAILAQDHMAGGIQQASSLQTWHWIDTAITLLNFLCPAVMAVGLWLVLRQRFARGMKLIGMLYQGLLWVMYGTSIGALGLFLFRMLRYILVCMGLNEGAYYIYSLLVTEGLMAVQAWLLWLLIRKFLRDGADCAFSIAYTLASGKLDSIPIPSFPSLGLVILGCIQLALAWDKAFTLTLLFKEYTLLTASHPGQYFASATLVTGAVGNLLLSLYLRKYNRICERTRFQANRLT